MFSDTELRLPSILCALGLLLMLLPTSIKAHGNVTLEDDLCIIRIGFYSAHFKIYLPRDKGHREYCEDIPLAGEAVFVMEYLHESLGQVPVDFRIIEDVTGLGRFARLQDLEHVEDLDSITVFYQSAEVVPDVYTALHQFNQRGSYLGIVTARHPELDQHYAAVFPFTVGFNGFGYWPLFLVLALLVHLHFWLANGGLARWRERKS